MIYGIPDLRLIFPGTPESRTVIPEYPPSVIGVGGGCAAGGWGCWGLGVVAAGGGPSREPSALSSEPSAASQPASAPAGPNVPQVLPRSTLELKVRDSSCDQILLYTAPATRTIFGSQGALIAPKRVSSVQTRFGALRTPKNVDHVYKSEACVILERKELQRRHFSDLERFGRKGAFLSR